MPLQLVKKAPLDFLDVTFPPSILKAFKMLICLKVLFAKPFSGGLSHFERGLCPLELPSLL